MKTFFDSSAYAKRFIEESGSRRVDEICQETDILGLSIICAPEIISALNRRRRDNAISPAHYDQAKIRLLKDIRDAIIVNLTERVIAETIMILEQNSLRAMDAIHVSSAILWETDLFITADQNQHSVAQKAGLNSSLII